MEITISSDCAHDIRQIFSVERRLSLEAKALLILIRATEKQVLTCPQPSLSRLLSVGVRALRAAILDLERLGLIESQTNRNKWGGTSASSYRLLGGRGKLGPWEAQG